MGTPIFTAMGTNPFGLADVGNYAIPVFVDIDNDGDVDGFIGNVTGNARFFLNTGTASAPAFSNVGSSPFGLADVGASAAPAFVDIDGDGDFDVLVGNNAGNTRLFLNSGTTSAPAFSNVGSNPFGLANVGSYATPTFVDIDGDGDFDVFIGNQAGNVRFFRNTGTTAAAAFSNAGSNPFGLADVGSYAVPTFVDIEGDGDFDAMIGNFPGNTTFFLNTGTANAPAFSNMGANPFGLADVGSSAAPTFVDIDGDGDTDALIGNRAGNTLLFVDSTAADLMVTKTDGVTSAVPGASITYTIVAGNAGPNDDAVVSLNDAFPASLTCTYTSVAAGGAAGNTAAGAGDLVETLSLPAGGSVTYTADCAIDASATGTLSNTATIAGSVADPVAGNNSATDADTALGPQADLSVTVTSSATQVPLGSPFTYTVTTTNNGPSDATGVAISGALPTGITLVSTTGCAEDPNGVPTCSLGTLASGANMVYTIDVSATGVTQSNYTVTVSSNAADPVGGNNSSSAPVGIAAVAVPSMTMAGLAFLVLALALVALKPLRRLKTGR